MESGDMVEVSSRQLEQRQTQKLCRQAWLLNCYDSRNEQHERTAERRRDRGRARDISHCVEDVAEAGHTETEVLSCS